MSDLFGIVKDAYQSATSAGDGDSGCILAIPSLGLTFIFPLPDDLSFDANYGWGGEQTDAMGDIANADGIGSAATGLGMRVLRSTAGDKIANVTQNQHGKAVNPREMIIFDGVKLRSFSLSFNISSKSKARMKQKIMMLNGLYAAAAPSLNKESNGAFFDLPPKAKLSIQDKANGGTHKIVRDRDVVITSVSTNLTPDGQFNTFIDGTPMHYRLTIGFTETTLPTSDVEQNIFLGK